MADAATLTEHQLLLFWLQLFLLVAVARGLGGLMRRIGQPAVVGELAAGLVLGPSLFGRIAPALHSYVFPADDVQQGLLLAVSWIGVVLLLVVTGFETDLKLLASLGRSSLAVSVGSLVAPLVVGFGLGYLLPDIFLGAAGERTSFALFLAVAFAVSSLPVVAKILMEMRLMRRNIGQVIVAGGVANDLVGWILLGVLAGIVTGGGFALMPLLTSLGAIVVFLVLSLTFGQRVTDSALRRARQARGPVPPFTVMIVLTLALSLTAQAIGVEAIIGAFVAGIILSRSRYRQESLESSLAVLVDSFLAPVFFAAAGLSVDLGLLAEPSTAAWAVVVIAAGTVSKMAGSFVGARVGGMSSAEGLAVSIGLNARGAVGIVIATIGLGLEILNVRSYTIIVVMALVTSMMPPPLLRRILSGMTAPPEEAARLEREAMLEASIIAGTRRALLPTRGGANSVLAARLLDLAMQPDTAITIHTVRSRSGGEEDAGRGDAAAREAAEWLTGRSTERIDTASDDVADAIIKEAELGYGVLAVGMSEGFTLSPLLSRVLTTSPIPVLLVKHGRNVDAHSERMTFKRLMVPSIGTPAGMAAEEVAYTLAASIPAPVDVVHVVNRIDEAAQDYTYRRLSGPGVRSSVQALLERSRSLAAQFGQQANVQVRSGSLVGPELLLAADEAGTDLLILGAQLRSYAGEPFLGHGVEWLLEHSPQTVVVVVLPDGDRGD